MPDYYSPGQLSVIYPFLKQPPRWLLLGGPADANEAQTAKAKWPDIKIIGVEANAEAVRWQIEQGEWPEGMLLLPMALSDSCGTKEMVFQPGVGVRNASLGSLQVEGNRNNTDCKIVDVSTTTFDRLDQLYGPFEEAIMWIDIESSELPAIKGSIELLKRGAIRLINAEGMIHHKEDNEELEQILYSYGFKSVKDWNDSPDCRDRIYIRE